MLEAGTANPSQLATSVGMTRGAVSKRIERLCRKKLVVNSVSGGDPRFQSVELTAAGMGHFFRYHVTKYRKNTHATDKTTQMPLKHRMTTEWLLFIALPLTDAIKATALQAINANQLISARVSSTFAFGSAISNCKNTNPNNRMLRIVEPTVSPRKSSESQNAIKDTHLQRGSLEEGDEWLPCLPSTCGISAELGAKTIPSFLGQSIWGGTLHILSSGMNTSIPIDYLFSASKKRGKGQIIVSMWRIFGIFSLASHEQHVNRREE